METSGSSDGPPPNYGFGVSGASGIVRPAPSELTSGQIAWCREYLRLGNYCVFALMERQNFKPATAL